MRILIDKTRIKPPVVNKLANIPRAWEKRVKDNIDRNVQLGVIEKVPENTPQTFCAWMYVVVKHNGDALSTSQG